MKVTAQRFFHRMYSLRHACANVYKLPFPKLRPRSIAVTCVALALTMVLACENAVAQQDDAFRVTSECDEALSRVTATKLFEFMERKFDPYRNAQPREVRVIEEKWGDNRPISFIHQAKFATFDADYYLVAGGQRLLRSLTTRSTSFNLPAGIRMGQSKSQVMHVLGPPTYISRNAVLYQIGGEAIHDVIFIFARDNLVQVDWAYGAAD